MTVAEAKAKAKLDEALSRLGFTGPLETAEAGFEALDFLLVELARKDDALRAIMGDDTLFEANPDVFGRYTWARIREIARSAPGEQP